MEKYPVVLIFESVNGILRCGRSNETSSVELLQGTFSFFDLFTK